VPLDVRFDTERFGEWFLVALAQRLDELPGLLERAEAEAVTEGEDPPVRPEDGAADAARERMRRGQVSRTRGDLPLSPVTCAQPASSSGGPTRSAISSRNSRRSGVPPI
jgi:hypothetical protein